jgi:hypothetical protein
MPSITTPTRPQDSHDYLYTTKNLESSDPDARAYRIRTLKIFGGIQIVMGILCGILSLVGVVIDGINMNKYCSYYPYYGKIYITMCFQSSVCGGSCIHDTWLKTHGNIYLM